MRTPGDARDHAKMAWWVLLATLGGAFALAPLTEYRAYLVVGVVSAGLVCLTGMGLRILRTPWPFVVMVQLLVLFWWAALTYAGDTATAGLIPNAETVRVLDDMLSGAVQHSEQYAPPVPRDADVHATLSIGVGLLALAVDLLAGSLHHAPAVGLVFLAVYMAPVALLSGQVGFWYFLPGALGFVFLLTAQERVAVTGWGRNVSYANSTTPALSRRVHSANLATAGRRVGFGAIALSVVMPLVIPTLSTNLFGRGGIDGGESGGEGMGNVQVDNPVLDMRRNLSRQSDAELVRMRGTTAPQYVRLASLDALDEDGWTPSQRGPKTEDIESSMPTPPGSSADVLRSSVGYDVEVTDAFESNWLPTVYAPMSVEAEGNWRIDAANLDVVAGDDDTSAKGLSYEFTAGLSYPTKAQLRQAKQRQIPASFDDMKELPDDIEVVEEQAAEVTAGETNDFDRAQALENWFRNTGGFEYSTARQEGNGLETIRRFVTDDRIGYCEQFASAMAMMARSQDIPARVAVGFLSGDRVKDTYVMRGEDMHAWPELYFQDVGWVRFEPTPSDRTGSGIQYGAPGDDNPEAPQSPEDNRSMGPAERPQDSGPANLDSNADDGSGDDESSGSAWRGVLTTGLAVVALVALAGVPRWLRNLRRTRRWRYAGTPAQSAEAAWSELRDTVRDLRLPWPQGATPRSAGRSLRPMIETREHAVDGLNRLVLVVERARYAEHPEPADLRDDVEAVCAALASRVSKRTRRRATWMPLSLLGGLRLPSRVRSDHGPPQRQELLALEE